MKILSKLTAADAQDAPDKPRTGIRQGYDHEIARGQFLRFNVADGGLLIETGPHQALIPLAELQALAAAHNPAFTAKK